MNLKEEDRTAERGSGDLESGEGRGVKEKYQGKDREGGGPVSLEDCK